MKRHLVKLNECRRVAFQRAAFFVERPAGCDYRAGQCADVTIEGHTYMLRFASAPHEEDLLFAARMRGSEFKRELDKLAAGDRLRVTGHRVTLPWEPTARRLSSSRAALA